VAPGARRWGTRPGCSRRLKESDDVSGHERHSRQTGGQPISSDAPYRFVNLDPPEHDRLRALAMRHFGPPERPACLDCLRPEIARMVTTLLDQLLGQHQFDFVDQFSYPLPVAVISFVLGVPREDEPQFRTGRPRLLRLPARRPSMPGSSGNRPSTG
jgi:cytochrome P450